MTTPVVVCAPNAFKGTLTAAAAAAALADGVRAAGATPLPLPVADGGDGTLDVLLTAHPGAHAETLVVPGPMGDPVVARIGWLDATTAVVELADAAGLRLVPAERRNPLAATTSGVGEVMLAALAQGAQRIILGVGGSATTDCGIGILAALGAELRDGDGRPVPPASGALAWIASIDLEPARRRLQAITLDIAVDVDNPLLGERGAARVFAPQKGADPRQVSHLEAGVERFAAMVAAATGDDDLGHRPGTGSAGGVGFGLAAVGGRLLPGAELVCEEIDFDGVLHDAVLVITGEGRLDDQTRGGKAPAEVARRCQRRGVRCIAICGEVADPLPDLFTRAIALGGGAGDPSMTAAGLRAAAEAAVRPLV